MRSPSTATSGPRTMATCTLVLLALVLLMLLAVPLFSEAKDGKHKKDKHHKDDKHKKKEDHAKKQPGHKKHDDDAHAHALRFANPQLDKAVLDAVHAFDKLPTWVDPKLVPASTASKILRHAKKNTKTGASSVDLSVVEAVDPKDLDEDDVEASAGVSRLGRRKTTLNSTTPSPSHVPRRKNTNVHNKRLVDLHAPPRPDTPILYVHESAKCGGAWSEFDLSPFHGAHHDECIGIDFKDVSSSSMPVFAALNCTQTDSFVALDLVEYMTRECNVGDVKWRITGSISVHGYDAEWTCTEAHRYTGFYDATTTRGHAGGRHGKGETISLRVVCP